MDAFATARRLAAWARLAPGNFESASKPKGAGTREGDVSLKSALFAAASAAVRTKGIATSTTTRAPSRPGARAHRRFHTLATAGDSRDLGEGHLDRVARKRSTTELVQRLSNLGYDVVLVPKAA